MSLIFAINSVKISMYLEILLLGLVVVFRLWFLLIDARKLRYQFIKRCDKNGTNQNQH